MCAWRDVKVSVLKRLCEERLCVKASVCKSVCVEGCLCVKASVCRGFWVQKLLCVKESVRKDFCV